MADDDEQMLAALRRLMISKGLQPPAKDPEEETYYDPLLSSFDLKGVAEKIADGSAQNIIVMCGAGISVNAGIPDFRSVLCLFHFSVRLVLMSSACTGRPAQAFTTTYRNMICPIRKRYFLLIISKKSLRHSTNYVKSFGRALTVQRQLIASSGCFMRKGCCCAASHKT